MKSNIKDILGLVEQLSAGKKNQLIEQIMQMMENPTKNGSDSMVEEYLNGCPDCPLCGAKAQLKNIVKRGTKANGAQRYYCKNCGRYFVSTTNTAFSRTHKSADTWKKFIAMTIDGKSIVKCACECKLSTQTAFTWRHKVLNAFKVNQSSTMMEGNVEIDEMLIPISYKGNHIKGSFYGRKKGEGVNTNMPRQAYERGTDNRSSSSKDKACIFCMVQDGNKGYYADVPGVGFMNNKMLDITIGKHTNREKALIVADQYKLTKKYLKDCEYNYITLASNSTNYNNDHKPEITEDGLHMQHVNALHHHIRLFLSKYCGVSTKYLDNYISLFIWIKMAKVKKQSKKINSISIGRAAASDCYITRKELQSMPAVPCCA